MVRWHVTCDTLHMTMTLDTYQMTHDMWYMTRNMWYFFLQFYCFLLIFGIVAPMSCHWVFYTQKRTVWLRCALLHSKHYKSGKSTIYTKEVSLALPLSTQHAKETGLTMNVFTIIPSRWPQQLKIMGSYQIFYTST